VERATLLPAYVDIMLAADAPERARDACAELEGIAARHGSAMLRARAAHARGAVQLANDDARGALLVLRRAWKLWQELEAPYEAAQARVLLARACRAVGDDETAAFELEAARAVFEQLGAASDLARLESLIQARGVEPPRRIVRARAAGAAAASGGAEQQGDRRRADAQ
jgi:hypothetical protein